MLPEVHFVFAVILFFGILRITETIGPNSWRQYYPQPEPQPVYFPGEVDYRGSYNPNYNRRGPENQYHQHIVNDARENFPRGRENTGSIGSKRCISGVCLHPTQCSALGGISRKVCPESGTHYVCCEFSNSCSHSSNDVTSTFKSPGYPGPTLGNLICQFDIILKAGVCAVRLEFVEFNTTAPLDRGLCHVDQFLVINALEGATFPRCGELTGYSTIVAVDARHKLPLTLLSIMQSSNELYKWNIKMTQIKCDERTTFKDYPDCGKSFSTTIDADSPDISNSKEKSASPEHVTTTALSKVEDDDNVVIFDDTYGETDQVFYSDVDSRQNVDNAFFIAYLKRAYEAITNVNTSDANSTLCKNRDQDIHSEKLQKLKKRRRTDEEDVELERIIRGKEALINEFPWQISISDNTGHICGGAIISNTSILTASHCFMGVVPAPLKLLKVIVGDFNLNSTTDTKHEQVFIKSVVFHSHFDPYYLEYDIALIKLTAPIRFRAGVSSVCLPEKGNSYVGNVGTTSGWGATTYPQGKLATTLQKQKNKIIENSECKKKLKIDYLYDTMLCAVAPNCSGTCFGDSGGPLTVKVGDQNVLVGLVSFGIGGCALLPFWPDVYTRVTSFIDWLSYAMY